MNYSAIRGREGKRLADVRKGFFARHKGCPFPARAFPARRTMRTALLPFPLLAATLPLPAEPAPPATPPEKTAPVTKAQPAKSAPDAAPSPSPAVPPSAKPQTTKPSPKPPPSPKQTPPPAKTAPATLPALGDSALFPPELYPALERQSAADLLLEGLSHRYPGRVVRATEAAAAGTAGTTTGDAPAVSAAAPPALTALFPGGIHYVRCYSGTAPDAAVPVPPATGDRLVDLRFFTSDASQVAACARLCAKLTGAAPNFHAVGKYPLGTGADAASDAAVPAQPTPPAARPRVVVLVNAATAGPVEAMLADLQGRGIIIIAGARTAGRTAAHAPVEGHPNWTRITGEIQPAFAAVSLVGTGVEPRVKVAVSTAADLLGWQWVERGRRPEAVLRLTPAARLNGTSASPPAASSPAPAAAPSADAADAPATGDSVLRRGYDLLAALQVMGGSPPFPKTPE